MRFWEVLAPSACVGCGTAGAVWCAACRAAAPPAPVIDLPGFAAAAACFSHEGSARRAVLAGKFGGQRRVAAAFAERVAGRDPGLLVVPVPDHRRTRAERDGSLAAAFAAAVARRLDARVAQLLRKPHRTPDQVGLDVRRRAEVQRHAFVAVRRLDGARVLLVDDVVTTGATAHAACAALALAGADRVSFLAMTVALAPRRDTR